MKYHEFKVGAYSINLLMPYIFSRKYDFDYIKILEYFFIILWLLDWFDEY